MIVWLEASGTPVITAGAVRAQMLQKNKTFIPHVLAISVGTVVDFPNYDPIFHNAFSKRGIQYMQELLDVVPELPAAVSCVVYAK